MPPYLGKRSEDNISLQDLEPLLEDFGNSAEICVMKFRGLTP